MNLTELRNMAKRLVLDPMIEFIEEYDCEEYTHEDVQQCADLVYAYLDALNALTVPTNEAIMEQVKTLVLALNDLNEATDYTLIETEAREALWEVIQTSAVACGLMDAPEDVTETWRDW